MHSYLFEVTAQRFVLKCQINNANSLAEAIGIVYAIYGKGSKGQAIMLKIELIEEVK